MQSLLQRCLNGICTLLVMAMAALPARAQLNPKIYQNLRTDFLDLYQKSDKKPVKPEIVTLLDFSGSMNQVMFDSRFYNNILEEPGAMVGGQVMDGAQGYRIHIRIEPVNSSRPDLTWKLAGVWLATERTGRAYVTTMDGRNWSGSGNVTYTVGGTYANGNKLMRPDGAGGYTEVTTGYVEDTTVSTTFSRGAPTLDTLLGSGEKSRNALNWMRAATHARMNVSWPGGPTRTLDIPLNWTVLEADYADGADVYTAYNAKPPLNPARALDPVAGTKHPYDLTYVDGLSVNTNWYGATNSNGYTDSALVGSSYGTWSGWRGTYLAWIFSAKGSDGQFLFKNTDVAPGFKNGLKGLTRIQAVKKALVETWLAYQDKVFWMTRGLATVDGQRDEVNPAITFNGAATVVNNDEPGGTRNWLTLNKHKGNALRWLAKVVANTGTPLTSSYGNTLAQFMHRDALKEIDSTEDRFLECTKHFLLVFTDGSPSGDRNPQEGITNQAYFKADGTGNRALGNGLIKGSPASLNTSSTYWNLPTLAGVAAHGGRITANDTGFIKDNTNTASPVTSPLPTLSSLRPFFISERPGPKRYKLSHPVQTMTVGVSLAQTIESNGLPRAIQNDPESPKYRMLAAALAGDPSREDWDLKTAGPYNPTQEKPTYFFDATSVDTLVDNLKEAFKIIGNLTQVTTTAMPGFPFVGSGFGSQVYLAKFDPPDTGGPIWPGDLVMFPTQKTSTGTVLLDGSGNPLTGNANLATPQWSAGRIFDKDNGVGAYRTWYSRKIFTRVPGVPVGGKAGQLTRFRDIDQDSSGFSDFKNVLPTGGFTVAADIEAYRKKLVRFVMGADVDVSNDADATKVPNRLEWDGVKFKKGVMGDVINSSPMAVEFGDMTVDRMVSGGLPADSPLITAWGNSANPKKRFRVIFVGTNLGVMHAFGEVSWEVVVKVGPTGKEKDVTVTRGVVDELWAFLPSDFLPFMDYLRKANETHKYMVDGSPMIYHLDLAKGSARSGNGKVDGDDEAMVIFGLGKGGRSYYGLDIRDPFNPKLGETQGGKLRGWALVPDEQPLASLMGRMGLSTCQPMFGRMITGTGTRYLKDMVFLGGGYTSGDMDGPTLPAGSDDLGGYGVKLGRSIFAIEVLSGSVLKSWDLGNQSFVDAGVVPFEMVPNSGLTQRVYYTDHSGKLWALGKNTLSGASGTEEFLEDSSELDKWSTTPRLVYKADATPTMNNVTSSLPAPFRITSWPLRREDPKVSPPVVGIAWATGDRFDPVDEYYDQNAPNTLVDSGLRPNGFRINVIYDRNDYYKWSSIQNGISSSNLANFSVVTSSDDRIKPGSSSYYIDPTSGAPYFGYYISFPGVNAAGYLPKGFNSPLVFLGVMAYSYFEPLDFDPCVGGNGRSYTNKICNVVLPAFPGNHVAAATTGVNGCQSGEVWSWVGVASRINLQSLTSAIQSGLSDTTGGGSTANPSLQVRSMAGLWSERFVRPRVWRTVD